MRASYSSAWIGVSPVVRLLRRLFRSTPPQTESGWHCLAARVPGKEDVRYDGVMEIYRSDTDEIFRGYHWSLACIFDGQEYYYWRKPQSDDHPDRHFNYTMHKSRTVFGKIIS
jgi:hypothetical protein